MNELMKTIGLKRSHILHGIDFSMYEGEMVAIMGPSGSGKSTFLYQLSGMDHPDSGQIFFLDKEITHNSEDENAKMRLAKIGFVFQQMNMLSNLNIIDNIILPAVQCQKSKDKIIKKSERTLRKEAKELMEKTGIGGLWDRKITEVSGGQLQRACICRAIINMPKLLLADEPTGALNRSASDGIMEEFIALNREGMSILIVTHDNKVASVCDRTLYLVDGKIAGECVLGKYETKEKQNREIKLQKWLEESSIR